MKIFFFLFLFICNYTFNFATLCTFCLHQLHLLFRYFTLTFLAFQQICVLIFTFISFTLNYYALNFISCCITNFLQRIQCQFFALSLSLSDLIAGSSLLHRTKKRSNRTERTCSA